MSHSLPHILWTFRQRWMKPFFKYKPPSHLLHQLPGNLGCMEYIFNKKYVWGLPSGKFGEIGVLNIHFEAVCRLKILKSGVIRHKVYIDNYINLRVELYLSPICVFFKESLRCSNIWIRQIFVHSSTPKQFSKIVPKIPPPKTPCGLWGFNSWHFAPHMAQAMGTL